jgi:MFS family permease
MGWRWAFLINLPIGIALIALAISSIIESRDPNAERLDYPESILFGAGLSSIVWALIAANSVGWESRSTLIKLGVGAALLVAFVFAERLHPRAMLDLALFRDRRFVGATIAMLGYASAVHVMMIISAALRAGHVRAITSRGWIGNDPLRTLIAHRSEYRR